MWNFALFKTAKVTILLCTASGALMLHCWWIAVTVKDLGYTLYCFSEVLFVDVHDCTLPQESTHHMNEKCSMQINKNTRLKYRTKTIAKVIIKIRVFGLPFKCVAPRFPHKRISVLLGPLVRELCSQQTVCDDICNNAHLNNQDVMSEVPQGYFLQTD